MICHKELLSCIQLNFPSYLGLRHWTQRIFVIIYGHYVKSRVERFYEIMAFPSGKHWQTIKSLNLHFKKFKIEKKLWSNILIVKMLSVKIVLPCAKSAAEFCAKFFTSLSPLSLHPSTRKVVLRERSSQRPLATKSATRQRS
jgi:hypothetical protein